MLSFQGLYFGYSSAFAVGNFLVGPLGWRWTFYISSFPGIILSFLIYFTVKEPERGLVDKAIANQEKSSIERTKQSTKDSDKMTTAVSPTSTSSLHLESDKIYSLKESFILFFTARSALLLCLAGAIRNAGGYVWYGSKLFNNYFILFIYLFNLIYVIFLLFTNTQKKSSFWPINTIHSILTMKTVNVSTQDHMFRRLFVLKYTFQLLEG